MKSMYHILSVQVRRLVKSVSSMALVAGIAVQPAFVQAEEAAVQADGAEAVETANVEEANTIPPIAREQSSTIEQQDEAERARVAVNQFSDQLQALKKRVVSLNSQIRVLEEDLLFPANTQTTVFVSMNTGEFFDLESVKLKINDKVVASHLYSEKELFALEQGGVQRLHLANLGSGQHEITAFFTGQGPAGREYKRAASAVIEKQKGPAYVELQVLDSESKQQPEFIVRQW